MEQWFMIFNGIFFISILGIIVGACFKSKCSEIKFCSKDGLIFIKRDVLAENEEIKIELEHGGNNV
jgi:hypothetical protein